MKLIEYQGEVLSGYVPDLPKRYFRKIIIMNKLIRASIKLVGALFVPFFYRLQGIKNNDTAQYRESRYKNLWR